MGKPAVFRDVHIPQEESPFCGRDWGLWAPRGPGEGQPVLLPSHWCPGTCSERGREPESQHRLLPISVHGTSETASLIKMHGEQGPFAAMNVLCGDGTAGAAAAIRGPRGVATRDLRPRKGRLSGSLGNPCWRPCLHVLLYDGG